MRKNGVPQTNLTGCSFYGVKWDEKATEAVSIVATGLLENAKALHKLADLFNSQHITIDCLLKVDNR